jgi:uncharacterized protein
MGLLLPMTESDEVGVIAQELGLPREQVLAAAALFDSGNTIPFVARYRKEATGALDEVQLRRIEARLTYLRHLSERRQAVLRSIDEQGKLTPDLQAAIVQAQTLQAVEDLYLPFRPKRRTRAAIARERGLEPLAEAIWQQKDTRPLEELAVGYLSEQVPDAEAALAGARDILAERASEDASVRGEARRLALDRAMVNCTLADEAAKVDPTGKYRLYHDVSLPIAQMQPHQWLAICRGEAEGALVAQVRLPDSEILDVMGIVFLRGPQTPLRDQLEQAMIDGYHRLLAPSLERDLRSMQTERADEHAIQVFSANLRKLLLQAPLRAQVVMGIDPGFRSGCKVAVVDGTGKVLSTATIYPHEPQRQWQEAKKALAASVVEQRVDAVAVGNGTASRETERLVAELCAEQLSLGYAIVSEAGASVYSASSLARQELPGLDVTLRGAVSIARRLQDPLAELVKIDPRSIGVGLYQHDVDQKRLGDALAAVVESVVNYVGVDVNTASVALLRYVAGVSPAVAANIVAHRDEQGPFQKRPGLREVRGLGPKAYEQAAGFLRVPCSANPLDDTPIHPESYAAVHRLIDLASTRLKARDMLGRVHAVRDELGLAGLADLLGVGQPTLVGILDALERPGRDPRADLPPPILRQDILRIEDLQVGMRLRGTVRNVVDFGAFVDVGVKQEGLVHVSQMAERYVRTPHEFVSVGDIVDVTVISVDLERGRIGLSMKKAPEG